MRALRSPLSSQGLLLLGVCSKFLGALASPSINVALRASWNSAPYLVELLETAAEENATAYYPLLDRIAEGYFEQAHTPQELFHLFVDLLDNDGHITDAETLASFQFALSVRSAAPRIEAHYQFYNTSVQPSVAAECETWLSFNGKQHCSPDLGDSAGSVKNERTEELPFDRVLGKTHDKAQHAILYADITAPSFASFHNTISKTAKEGKNTYRIRHKPSSRGPKEPLIVNGYGVELQLKRTDYIVIDDRQAAEGGKTTEQKAQGIELEEDEEVADLKPLSASEVSNLAVDAASFVLNSENPLDTLQKLVQDFPKHSSAIAAHNTSAEFLQKLDEERMSGNVPPALYSLMMINGVQISPRDVNPFSLLEHLRRERKLINSVRGQGLSGPEAISLLSHPAITENQLQDEPQRYDFRDAAEGGNVIVWLNNIEKDKRYESWPTEITALLQRTYPGQLPSVRRDIHNAIVPVDFSSREDVSTVVDTVQMLIKRKIPVRWGLVPLTPNAGAVEQAKIVYHLHDTYGLAAAIHYLETARDKKKLTSVDKAIFDAIVSEAKLRNEKEPLAFADVLKSDSIEERVVNSRHYLNRLAAAGPNAPSFVNGVPIPQNDEWLQMLSQRVSMDLRQIQRGVYEGTFEEHGWLPSHFLTQAAHRRNPLIIPENEKDIKLINMAEFCEKHGAIVDSMPKVKATDVSAKNKIHLMVVADFDSDAGLELLKSVGLHRLDHENIEVVLIHNPKSGAELSNASEDILETWVKTEHDLGAKLFMSVVSQGTEHSPTRANSTKFWKFAEPIYGALDLKPGQSGLLLNGRLVGPVPAERSLSKDDVETFIAFETSKRIKPLSTALEALNLVEKIASPVDFAKLQSLVALSTVSDIPDGIFDSQATMRLEDAWNSTLTAITHGDKSTAIFQIVANIDPATELAQKWVPILKALSEMDGVHLKLFLSPTQNLDKLPVKRFYRYLLDSRPTFNDNGDIVNLQAEFTGIPKDALLNLGMDVPPSWLVAPEESVHDLDNIKLSSLPQGANIDAIYGLESILIEGHSRDVTHEGRPPRGAELVLSTEKEPHFADTIIMANLGYFQFKTHPGFYKIQLKSGRSQEIFTIDSAGTKGWAPVAGDETNEIVLMSFQGTTLFPRLSRKPGKEDADVLEAEEGLASEIVEKGTQKVNKLLDKIGLSKYNLNAEKVLKSGSDLLSKTGLGGDKAKTTGVQADINIFSVASGHLYERMLNIMMLSVMKHTQHTVKFWFIEQFLSPSFKSFLPTMAKEYGFDYELVTYKWPHWLRGQTEKQREIWGYKILFLDVLFPLDLDKVIFVDADQIVRTDMYELVQHDLHGAPYGFTPMCDSRESMEGFRFWKQGYWKNFLRGLPYHISALYVVDLRRFRALAAGDRLRQQYHQLSADPNSLSNLDQDLPNNMQFNLPIHSLPQEWLWCETWCSDESLKDAKTIDLCNNPQTKEPKLDRARRQVPEWTVYDEEIAALGRRVRGAEKKEDRKVMEAGEPQAWGGERVGEETAQRVKDEL